MTDPDSRQAPVPVTILSGFLGAGKTTLLQRLLTDPQGRRFGVLVNDFGAINIDAALIVEAGSDQVSLANGCICCTIKDDLVAAARQLLANSPPPDHLIVETSGVSRPLAVIEALEELEAAARLESVFCVVDATGFLALDFAATELAIEQAVCADIVLLNKCDIASPAEIEAAETSLTGILPQARILHTRFAEAPRGLLFEPPLEPAALKLALHDHDHATCGHDHHHDHGEEFESWSWQSAEALDEAAFLQAVRQMPPALLRIKGVLRIAGHPAQRGIYQRVGTRGGLDFDAHPAPAVSELVAIGRRGSFDAEALTTLLAGCVSGGNGAA
ncbi:MAG: GTP-binding protein [Alphaproteobacteria bacterium]|nr:GTP-binding protein [Alphaproteobacteria bacterium]MBU0797816.1 GTP-binding protein [Alphaproteobacteria bacterium]MBU0888383.1 GTP-binding protein [Alphaproteobacteria bacterium]MBU1814694.1 GTP-binding protein [Alphaproteobacteria bacterium]MBU2089563.1 GTP-binding protein [Alphaproteobacteria bacterium]